MNSSLAIVAIIAGLTGLTWGADRFITGAAATARRLGLSPLLVGITLVAFGTSAPEVVVSLFASFKGNGGLAVGNALGSNIANIGLVLGCTALIRPLTVHSSTLTHELPILYAVTLIATALLANQFLGQVDGLILFSLLLIFISWLIWSGTHAKASEPMAEQFNLEVSTTTPLKSALLWLLVGLVLVLVSAHVLVEGAVFIAKAAGVSDLIIGLTIIAIGTSLPELATSLAGALKGEHDIALGNIIGSNIFNLVAVLPIPALFNPRRYPAEVFYRDTLSLLIFSTLLLIFAFRPTKPAHINRWEGLLLLLAYCSYLTYLAIP